MHRAAILHLLYELFKFLNCVKILSKMIPQKYKTFINNKIELYDLDFCVRKPDTLYANEH